MTARRYRLKLATWTVVRECGAPADGIPGMRVANPVMHQPEAQGQVAKAIERASPHGSLEGGNGVGYIAPAGASEALDAREVAAAR